MQKIEEYRVLSGQGATERNSGFTGTYIVPANGRLIRVILFEHPDWLCCQMTMLKRGSKTQFTSPTPILVEGIRKLVFKDTDFVIDIKSMKGRMMASDSRFVTLYHPKRALPLIPPYELTGIEEEKIEGEVTMPSTIHIGVDMRYSEDKGAYIKDAEAYLVESKVKGTHVEGELQPSGFQALFNGLLFSLAKLTAFGILKGYCDIRILDVINGKIKGLVESIIEANEGKGASDS